MFYQNRSTKIIQIVFLINLISITLLGQNSEKKGENQNRNAEKAKINSTQAVEADIIFKDATNSLLRITDEGNFGAIQFQSGTPSDVANKLYNNSGTLYFGSTSLSSSGATGIDDLTDAKYEGENIFLGVGAGENNIGAVNTAVGHNSLNSNIGGSNNTAIGWKSLNKNTTGNFNTAAGLGSLLDNTIGTLNNAFGSNSLANNTSGSNNVGVGYGANYNNEQGSNNTIIGTAAGFGAAIHNKSGSVFIGYNAGYNETSDDKLYIENSNSDSPLIWGDFANDSVKINGMLKIINSLSIGSTAKSLALNGIAVGNNTQTHGTYGIAVGNENLSWGFQSAAFGSEVRAMAYCQTAIGRFNVANGLNNQTDWIETDVLFEIGNGTDNDNRSNAVTVLKNGNVGIGPSSPTSSLHVDAVNGILFDGATTGSIPAEGSGSRLMWYQGKSAFRAGNAGPNNNWDDINIGEYSTALNYRTKASGTYSFATGYETEANGQRSTAMGSNSKADGLHSTAIGSNTEAIGDYSAAIGRYVKVGAAASGTIFLGDNSVSSLNTATTANRFSARFDGGYRFFTKSDLSTGALMNNGDNSWSTVSDSTKKENFQLVDGEEILQKISKLKLTSWNYKTQNPSKFRHYGPMAQDFYAAFGNDGVGTVGNDTTIASADFDGINLIAIQELERRTRIQEEIIFTLKNKIAELENQNNKLNSINIKSVSQNDEMKKELGLIRKTINQILIGSQSIILTKK